MAALQTVTGNVTLVINLITYFSYVALAILLLYFGKTTDFKRKIRLPWVILSLGIVISASGQVIEILNTLGFITIGTAFISSHVTMLVGTALAFFSFSSLYLSRIHYINNLRKRHREIRSIMGRLKEKYFRRQLSEEELRNLYTDLTKELVEIEVKLKEMERTKFKS